MTGPSHSKAAQQDAKDPSVLLERYLPLAPKTPSKLAFRINGTVAMANLRNAVAALERPDLQAKIHAELPTVDGELLEDTVRLTHVFDYVHSQVRPERRSAEFKQSARRATTLRKRMLLQLELAVNFGLLPKERLRKVTRGNGLLNTAHGLQECIALLSELKKHQGDHWLVAVEEFNEALALVHELLVHGARGRRWWVKEQRKANKMAIARARLWALVVQRHELLWRIGAWVWGKDVGKYIPAISRKGVKRRRRPKKEPLKTVPSPAAP
jgi:hypothetical protein